MAVWPTLSGTTTAVRSGAWAFVALTAVIAALMAGPGVAAAAPQPVDGLFSPTHADTGAWYANGSPQFSWNAQTGVAGYTYTLDQNAASVPAVSPLSLPAVGFAFTTEGVGANPWQVASGDVNGDGSVDGADVFYLANFLFAGGPDPIGSADTNSDGAVNVSDLFFLVNYLFGGGEAPGPA